jgi:hypothetical protein
MTGLTTDAGADDPLADAEDRLSDLRAAANELSAVEADIEERGEQEVEAVADAHRRALDLLDRYEDRATGSGGETFRDYLEFQERFLEFVEGLDDDLPRREVFEETNDSFDKRRLTEADFEAGRETLAPAGEIAGLLDRRSAARSRYREARRAVERRRSAIEARIDELERLEELDEIDLDAPVGRLREPIEAYNESIRDAFGDFVREASARELLAFVEATEAFPLVGYRRPPDDLREYVRSNPAGESPVPTLLEYADYSTSKLAHYVDDPAELKSRVAVHRTYLERLDADPLTLSWPPAPAAELRHRVRELVSTAGRIAPDGTVARLREVRSLTREDDYERLRRVAIARDELDEAERERLASGAVAADLAAARETRDRLDEALDAHLPLSER